MLSCWRTIRCHGRVAAWLAADAWRRSMKRAEDIKKADEARVEAQKRLLSESKLSEVHRGSPRSFHRLKNGNRCGRRPLSSGSRPSRLKERGSGASSSSSRLILVRKSSTRKTKERAPRSFIGTPPRPKGERRSAQGADAATRLRAVAVREGTRRMARRRALQFSETIVPGAQGGRGQGLSEVSEAVHLQAGDQHL